MRWSLVVALVGCSGEVTLSIESDRPIPRGLDAICVGIADTDLAGGAFGRAYRLEGALATLPQTLRIEAGDADAAWAWVRGDRGGVPVVHAASVVDFTADVSLGLGLCQPGAGGVPMAAGEAMGPPSARLAVSQGAGGQLVVAVGGAGAVVIDVAGETLSVADGPLVPPGDPVAILAADVDGDCDDDLIVATTSSPPAVWRRDGVTFTDVGRIGDGAAAAVAAADVDRDGDVDLVTGSGGTLTLFRNDASGAFAADPGALGGAGRVTAVSAVALGDLDGDGHPDLVVGQAGGPLAAWLGEPAGTGSFLDAEAVVPAVMLDVERMVLADADGDLDPDLAVAVRGGASRLYIDREGRLEDQTFVRLPRPVPPASAIAIGAWDAGCAVDGVFAGAASTVVLRGQDGGTFASEASLEPASDVVLADLDDDGDLDAVLATGEGVRWIAR